MRTTIDAAGRIVVPKAIRNAMGLSAGREIDLTYVEGRIEIDLAPVEGTVIVEDGWPVLTPARSDLPALDDQTLRDTVEATRRRRSPATRASSSRRSSRGTSSMPCLGLRRDDPATSGRTCWSNASAF